MSYSNPLYADPIDAVITWVDGASPEHRARRQAYMEQAAAPFHANAINPHRWESAEEILFCLQSIDNFAPWVRTIWIVVDGTRPDLSVLSEAVRGRVRFVDHRDIFRGYEAVLPTFNSLAIESMIWRIEGLSERFLYFNDDVFLTALLEPSDLFHGMAPVLRGRWVDYSALVAQPEARGDPAKFNHFMQINAASLAGLAADRVFAAAHVVHPIRRARMAALFEAYPEAFQANIRHRFRDLSQFLPQGLHNHVSIAQQDAVLLEGEDYLHIKSGQGTGQPASETQALLHRASGSGIKFLCVNDLPQLEALVPQAREWLGRVVGGFPA